MTPNEAKAMGHRYLSKHNLRDWDVRLVKTVRKVGYCNYAEKYIALSIPYVELNPDHEIEDTILHEIAHALTPGEKHSQKWKDVADQLGAIPKAQKQVIIVPGRIYTNCSTCGSLYRRHRMPTGDRYCKLCYKQGKGEPLVWKRSPKERSDDKH